MKKRNSKASPEVDVREIIKEFEKSEESKAHRKGTFKINEPFEKAVDSLLKSRPRKKHK